MYKILPILHVVSFSANFLSVSAYSRFHAYFKLNMEHKKFMMFLLLIFLSMVSKTEAEDCYGSSPYPYNTHYECKLIGQIKLSVAAFWIAALAVSYITFTKPAVSRGFNVIRSMHGQS